MAMGKNPAAVTHGDLLITELPCPVSHPYDDPERVRLTRHHLRLPRAAVAPGWRDPHGTQRGPEGRNRDVDHRKPRKSRKKQTSTCGISASGGREVMVFR
jgi:hypothetical protein